MGNILTLEDFNTIVGLYSNITSEYIIDSDEFDGEGYYDFLDVYTEHNTYVVDIKNSLFNDIYEVLTGASVSYTENTFRFPMNQRTRIKIMLGANAGSKSEFTRFVARPSYEDYICNITAKDNSGNLLTGVTVEIGEYTGTTNSNGEVAITIPKNKADTYVYPITINDNITDSLELLRTKTYLNPVCITEQFYKEITNTLSFNLGNIGHSVSCKCIINNYTYTASSDAATGVVSFTIPPILNDDLLGGSNAPTVVNYQFKVLADDWVYEANLNGTINQTEYYTVNSWNNLKSAYNNNLEAVKINGTITADSDLTITRDFKVIGGAGNLLQGSNSSLTITGNGYLELNNINITDVDNENNMLVSVKDSNSKIVLNNCNVTKESSLFNLNKGEIECWNSIFTDCTSPIFVATSSYNKNIVLQGCEFNITDFNKTSHDLPLIINNNKYIMELPLSLSMDYCRFNVAVDGTDNDGVGSRLTLFKFNSKTVINNRDSAYLDSTLNNSNNYGDYYCEITVNDGLKIVSGYNKAFIWIVETTERSMHITEEWI